MAGELQRATVGLITAIFEVNVIETPSWLLRPAQAECGSRWQLVRAIYDELTSMELPEMMPPRETRRVDAVLDGSDAPRILEVDESQHFNRYRAATLRRYPADAGVAFPIDQWIAQSDAKTRLEGGGFGRLKPPLFPAEHGRHMQRAFRDMLADLVPVEHGYAPTLPIGDFEVLSWIYTSEAEKRMRELLSPRMTSV